MVVRNSGMELAMALRVAPLIPGGKFSAQEIGGNLESMGGAPDNDAACGDKQDEGRSSVDMRLQDYLVCWITA